MTHVDPRRSSRIPPTADAHLKAMIETMVREGFSEQEIIKAVKRATRS
jgi:hypothetical protein